MDKIEDDEIDQFIGIVHDEVTDKQAKEMEEYIKGTFLEIVRPNLNYELFLKRHEILGLQTKDDILKYSLFLQEEQSLTNLFNFQKLFKTEEFITNRVELNNTNCQKVKNLSNTVRGFGEVVELEKYYNWIQSVREEKINQIL